MSWNYKDPKKSIDSIMNAEFKKKYTDKIQGTEVIKAEGLKFIAHEKGIKELTTTIMQMPSQENQNTCIIQARLVGYDASHIDENKIEEVIYTAIGDASPSSCNPKVAKSYIRMAETRAISRVLKNFTNVGMLAYEELGEDDRFDNFGNGHNNNNNKQKTSHSKEIEEVENATRPATSEQKLKMTQLMKEKNLSATDMPKILETLFGEAKSFGNMTYSEVSVLLQKLKSLPKKKVETEIVDDFEEEL